MDLARLTELETLFGRRHQALALLCLFEEGAMRWAEIARAMQRRAVEHIHDKEVTRSLQALQTAGYIRAALAENGSQVRTLTTLGTRRAERMAQILGMLDNQPFTWPAPASAEPPQAGR